LRELLPLLAAALVPFAVLLLIITGTLVSLVVWQPPILQTIQLGTANSGNGVTAITSDPTGVYAAGFVGFSNVTPTYMFVNKYGLDGRQIWTQHFGYPSLDVLPGVPVTSEILGMNSGTDGVYFSGYVVFSSANMSSFVTKYDFNGAQVWKRQFFQNSLSSALSVSSSARDVYVAGFNGTNYFVKSYDLDGNLGWTKEILVNYADRISVLAGSNGAYVAYDNATYSGVIQGYDSNWTLQWTRTCSCEPMGIIGAETALFVFGVQPRVGIQVGFLTKYDLEGNQLWTTQINPSPGRVGSSEVNEVRAATDSSGIYLGTVTTDDRGIVMKYDSNGDHDWSLQLPWKTGSLYSLSNVITIQQSSLYIGGDLRTDIPTGVSDTAFIANIGESSSLVFFGINPPFSSLLLGALIVVAVLSILFFRRANAKRMSRRSRSASLDRFRKPGNAPAD
jgi:hypothetical protein